MKSLHAVVHCIDSTQTRRAIDVARENGANGVFLINQGGMSASDVIREADAAATTVPADFAVGVNLLGWSPQRVREAVRKSHWLWFDGYPGMPMPADAAPDAWNHVVFAGVLFKYQDEDDFTRLVEQTPHGDNAAWASIQKAMHSFVTKSDVTVAVTSGSGTGVAASPDKVERVHRAVNGVCKVGLASGVTPDNAEAYLKYVDHFLVATGIEESFGIFDPAKVRALAEVVHS